MPELVRNAKFLEGLGIGSGRPRITSLGKVADLPPAIPIERDYFIVFPGAGWRKRKWPAERFADAARSIAEQTGLQLLVCGSLGEAALAQEVIDLSGLLDALQLAGRTTLPELVELVRGARLLIGNESSAVHVAAGVGTPSVCLLGGGQFNRFVPYPESVQGIKPHPVYHAMPCYGCDWRCDQPHQAKGPVPCIASIGVDGVIQAALVLASREEHVECLRN
jgi:ADP-heptose:LPS heptosyltransferase